MDSHQTLMLGLRAWTMALLLISIAVMSSAKSTVHYYYYSTTAKFSDSEAFTYVISISGIVLVYSIVQAALVVFARPPPPAQAPPQTPQHVVPPFVVFLADMGVSYLLMSCGTAGAAVVNEIDYADEVSRNVMKRATVAIVMVFFAFVTIALCAIASAHRAFYGTTLENKVNDTNNNTTYGTNENPQDDGSGYNTHGIENGYGTGRPMRNHGPPQQPRRQYSGSDSD